MRPTKREMEERLGITRAQAEADAHPAPVCPVCGCEDVEFVPREWEGVYTRVPAHLECQDCGHTFRGDQDGN